MKTYLKPQTEVNSLTCGMNLLQFFGVSHKTEDIPTNPPIPVGEGLG